MGLFIRSNVYLVKILLCGLKPCLCLFLSMRLLINDLHPTFVFLNNSDGVFAKENFVFLVNILTSFLFIGFIWRITYECECFFQSLSVICWAVFSDVWYIVIQILFIFWNSLGEMRAIARACLQLTIRGVCMSRKCNYSDLQKWIISTHISFIGHFLRPSW